VSWEPNQQVYLRDIFASSPNKFIMKAVLIHERYKRRHDWISGHLMHLHPRTAVSVLNI